MNNWQIEYQVKSKNLKVKSEELIKILLKNRGISEKKEIDAFLSPNISSITPESVGINSDNLKKAVLRIKKAIDNKEKIIIYGDYDVDGVCASAILWETLNNLRADVMPFIPSRFIEGYGLSKDGIEALLIKQKVNLIITVDNGIVANDAVDYASKKGIDVIITDHHTPSSELPKALAIVHTVSLCGAGVAYLLSHEFKVQGSKFKDWDLNHLELVALATIADLVPLKGANRNFVIHGLNALRNTKRFGLLALFDSAGINLKEIGVYEIGHMIAPRLNAMGRLEDAMDSLRLICTNNNLRAKELAKLLSDTNLNRQQITIKALENAKSEVEKKALKKLIFISSKDYQQGIVGLVAGRLVEEYYLPAIVISRGEKFSKASARSVKGFNITEFLRSAKDLLVDIGGHPMAAGFTVETDKIELLEKKLLKEIENLLNEKHLERSLRIDLNLPKDLINKQVYDEIQKLSPFGMGNPEPTFLTNELLIKNLKPVGNDGKHLKIQFAIDNSPFTIEGIYFKGGENNKHKIGDKVDVVYVLDENEWNGNKRLQIKIKDIRRSKS